MIRTLCAAHFISFLPHENHCQQGDNEYWITQKGGNEEDGRNEDIEPLDVKDVRFNRSSHKLLLQ